MRSANFFFFLLVWIYITFCNRPLPHCCAYFATVLSKTVSLLSILFACLHLHSILSHRHKTEWSSEDEIKELNAVAPPPSPADKVQAEETAPCLSYKKSLRLSSDQIVRL